MCESLFTELPPRDHGNTRTSYVGYRSLCRRLVTSFLYKKSPCLLNKKVHLSSNKKFHLSSTGKVHVYITRKSIFPLTRKSIFPLQEKSMFTLKESPSLHYKKVHLSSNKKVHQITREILHKNVLWLRDRRNTVVNPRCWLAFAHRSTQIWQHVLHDRSGVSLGDAITQRKRRIITFWG